MTALSSYEKSLLRAGGHKATLYLSVLKPQIIFTARVNMTSPPRGARSIVYDDDTGAANVRAGMTLWVGSTAGACDVGRVRVRAINTNTNTLIVSENNLIWADNQYLTVKRNWELWPVFPRFDAAGHFYKDYDISYTDQNLHLGPIALLGPPRAEFDDGSETTFFFSSQCGYGLGGATIVSAAWDVVGPGSYTWTTNGGDRVLTISGPQRFDDAHWVTLTVTDSNGKTQTTRRPVFCHTRTGPHAPMTDFTLESLTGDWECGGWTARLRVYSGATIDDFPDGTLIVLWHEAIYGSTPQFIGGNDPHAKNILFAGYVRGETVTQDWNAGDVLFEATTIDGLLRRSLMFSVPIESVTGALDQWYELAGPTVAEAVYYYWRWQSTLFDIADVYLPTENTLRAAAIDDFVRGDLYSPVDTFAREHGIFAHVCCNKLGQVYVAEDAQILPDARRDALTVVSDITPADRRGEITIVCQPEPRVAMVHLTGVAYPGTPIVSKAPGDAPLDIGAQVVHVERQILANQTQANALAGRVLAALNNPYPEVRIQFAGHYLGALDIVPQEWWTLSLVATDTPRGIVWDNKRLLCRNVTASYDPAAGSVLVDAVFEPEAEGPPGVNGDYPTTPPQQDHIEPPPPPIPPTPPVLASGRLATFDHSIGHLNQTTSGTWQVRNAGATTVADNQGGFDPHWPTVQNSTDIEDAILWRVQTGHIYRSTNCGRSWSEVTGMGNPPNSWNDDPAPVFSSCDVVMGTPNNYKAGEWYFLVRWQNNSGQWRGWILRCTGNGSAWTWESLGGMSYCTTGNGYYYVTREVRYTPASQPGYYLTINDRENVLGYTPETFATIQGNQDGSGQTPFVWDLDLGGVAEDCDDFQYLGGGGNINVTGELYVSTDYVNWTQWRGSGNGTVTITNANGWTRPTSVWNTLYHDVRYIRLQMTQWNNAFHWLRSAQVGGFRVHTSTGFTPAGGGAVYPIWLDVETADGTYLYLTMCGEDDKLVIQKRRTRDLSLVHQTVLGTTTLTNIINGTYSAYPRVKEFDPNVVYVHGRLPSGAHLLRSTDAGVSFASVATTFDSDHHVGAFIVGHDGVLWAVENTGGAPVLWRNTGNGFVAMPPVPLSGNVPPDGITLIPSSSVIALASSTAVVRSADAGVTWTNQSYPAGGSIRSLLFIA